MRFRPSQPDPFDAVNRRIWADSQVVEEFAAVSSFLDDGERISFEDALRRAPGRRVLDIGVGAGRTVECLHGWASTYVAIDCLPGMVRACAARYPEVDVRLGDARNLEFADGSFDLVVFSNNGLDAMGHEDRRRAVREVARVLGPRGLFAFSTYNLDGPSARERPWTLPGLDWRQPRRSLARVRYRVRGFFEGLSNYRRLARASYESGDGWAVRIQGSHRFGIVVHHTTLTRQHAELRDCGFTDVDTWSGIGGERLTEASSTSGVWYFHLVCRKVD